MYVLAYMLKGGKREQALKIMHDAVDTVIQQRRKEKGPAKVRISRLLGSIYPVVFVAAQGHAPADD